MSDPSRFALHRPELLSNLLRGEQRIIDAMKGEIVSLSADASLVRANTDHDYIYRLVQGWAARSRLLPDGRNQFILIFLPGDLFGIKSMFMDRHPDAIRCISACRLERIGRQRLLDLYRSDSDVAMRCTWQVMEEERRLHSWVVGLGQGSSEERLAFLFVEFLNRLQPHSSGNSDSIEYAMPLTQTQLADLLGITAVHLNRTLRVLRDSGIVVLRDGILSITNLAALKERAAPLMDIHDRKVTV